MAPYRLVKPMGGLPRRLLASELSMSVISCQREHESCLCRPERAAKGTLSQSHLGEPFVGRLAGTSGSFRMTFSARAYVRQQYSSSRNHCTIIRSFPNIIRRSESPLLTLEDRMFLLGFGETSVPHQPLPIYLKLSSESPPKASRGAPLA